MVLYVVHCPAAFGCRWGAVLRIKTSGRTFVGANDDYAFGVVTIVRGDVVTIVGGVVSRSPSLTASSEGVCCPMKSKLPTLLAICLDFSSIFL